MDSAVLDSQRSQRDENIQNSFVADLNEDDKSALMQVIKNDDEDSDWSRQDDSYD